MSFAIIQTGGKQYKVKSGEILKIERLSDSKPDTKIEFKEILAYGDDKVIEVGTPIVQGAKVEANLIKNSKNRTVLIFKKRRRQNSRRKNGHRQQYSLIKISKIFNMSADVRLGFYRACESRGIFAEQVPVPMVTSFVVLPAPHSLPREPVKQSTLCQGSRGLLHL